MTGIHLEYSEEMATEVYRYRGWREILPNKPRNALSPDWQWYWTKRQLSLRFLEAIRHIDLIASPTLPSG